jgi:serine/threonine protein kinase
VTELIHSGNLFNYLDKNGGPLNEVLASHIIFETLYAINHCHQEGICHRNIKPQNLLIRELQFGKIIKLIDFGTSFKFDKNSQNTKQIWGN